MTLRVVESLETGESCHYLGYKLGFWSWPQVLEFGPIGQAKVIGKPLTKAEVYRACFKDFLLNNRDAAKAVALSKALTSQEFRYFKQAYKALPPCSFPSSSLNPSFWNYLEVVEAYDYTKT